MTESFNNFSVGSPLGPNKLYIGSYDQVTNFATAKISIVASTDMEIIAYQSQDRIQTFSTTYQYTSSSQANFYLQLTAPSVYFTCRNVTATQQTLFNFTVIYSQTQVNTVSLTPASNVNIFANNGMVDEALTAIDVPFGMGSQNKTLAVTQFTANQSGYLIGNQEGDGTATPEMIPSLYVINKNQTNGNKLSLINLIGQLTSFEPSTTTANITIWYSIDQVVWFQSSLGQITFTTSPSQFSRDWESSAQYVGITSDNAFVGTLAYSVSQ
jgi:hypothetical protein